MRGVALRHVVLFRVRDGVPEEDVDAALTALAGLAAHPDVLSMEVARSSDERKGRVLAEVALLADDAALQRFRGSRQHQAVAAQLSGIADWLVADWLLPGQ